MPQDHAERLPPNRRSEHGALRKNPETENPGGKTLSILTGNRGKPHQKKCYRIVMNPEGLPHNPDAAERVIQKYLKLMSLHRELASLYRTKSRDRRTIANLWYYIDGLELDLRAGGVKL